VPNPGNRATFVAGAAGPVDLQIGPGGDLFYVSIGGSIRRIQFTSGNQPPNAVIQATPLSGPVPLAVTFSSVGSSDPDGDPITFSWNFGDGVTSTQANPSHTYESTGTFTAVLTVTDSLGAPGTDQVTITSGNSKPTAFIDTPAATTQWEVGQSIPFSGHATDPDQGTLPPSAFLWEVILHHCPSTNCHMHPVQSFSGVTTASFPAPDHDYPSHLELKLTVTDAGGLKDTKSVLLNPQTVALNFQSDPSGLRLVVGSSNAPTPFTRTVILKSKNSVSAVTPQALGGTNYKFVSWSDGGTQSHTITATAAATYTATYEVTTDPIPSPPPPSGDSGGGGCTLDRTGTGDAMLPALFLVVLGLLLLRIKRRANKAGRTIP
jgi:PKD repeat protein